MIISKLAGFTATKEEPCAPYLARRSYFEENWKPGFWALKEGVNQTLISAWKSLAD